MKTVVAVAVLSVLSSSVMAAPSDAAFGQLSSRVDAHDQEINDLGMTLGQVRTATVQNNVKINDLKSDLQNAQQGIHDAVQHAGSNSAAIARLQQVQSQLGPQMIQNANDIADNKQSITDVKTVADKAATDNTRQDGQIRNIQTIVQNENNARKADIAANKAAIDANKAATDKSISDLQTHTDDGFVKLNAKVNDVKAVSDKNTQAITALGGRMTTVETKVDGVQSATVSLNKDLNAARTDIAANTKSITDTQVKVTANEQNIVKVQQQTALNTSDLAKETAARTAADTKLQTGIDANKQGVTEAKSDATTANAKADMNTQSINQVNRRVDHTDQDVATMRGDVDTNTANINALNQWQQQANANLTSAVNDNSAGIARNSQRLDKVEKDVGQLKQDVKALDQKVGRVGAMSMATASLHYNGLQSGGAIGVGTYDGAAAIAAGAQFNINNRTAANVQVAYDGQNVGAGAGIQVAW